MKKQTYIWLLIPALIFAGCASNKVITPVDTSPSEAIQPIILPAKKIYLTGRIDPAELAKFKQEQEAKNAEVKVEQKQQAEQSSLVASAKDDTVNETTLVPMAAPNSSNKLTLEMVYKLAQKNEAGVEKNAAEVKQLHKAVNGLSLMVLLNRYGKGKIVALRYRFKYGGSKLSALATKDLTQLRTLEKKGKAEVVLFEGYSDYTGSLSKNKKLARARAENGRKFYSADIKCTAQAIGNGSVNIHGLKVDDRCLIVYVKILKEDIGFRRF